MFYCEVANEDKVLRDDGDTGEFIEFFINLNADQSEQLDTNIDVIEVTMKEAQDMFKQGSNIPSPPNCMFGVLWFLRNKKK